MFTGNNLNHYSPQNALIWLSLAFQAGVINVGGYLACHRFVTHTTGFSTFFGVELAQGHIFNALGMLSVPIFFLLGSMLGGILVDLRLLKNQRPRYSMIFFLMTFCLAFIVIAGNAGFLGSFGEPLNSPHDYLLLILLCLTSGLQNATVTSVFGAIIRTTHLTGLTTDLGIGLMRVFSGNYKATRQDEIRAIFMRMGIIAAFACGSFAAFVFVRFQYWGFTVPALVSGALLFTSLKSQRRASIYFSQEKTHDRHG